MTAAAKVLDHRGGKPQPLGMIVGGLQLQLPTVVERPLTAAAKLERLERDLVDLLTRQAPATWKLEQRRLRRAFRAAHRELTAPDRQDLRATIAAPTSSQQPARRRIPAGRGVR